MRAYHRLGPLVAGSICAIAACLDGCSAKHPVLDTPRMDPPATAMDDRGGGAPGNGMTLPGVPPTNGTRASTCPRGDCDEDGYSPPIDCNDHDPTVNPEAYDFIGDDIDNDCDGVVDNPVETCGPADDGSKDPLAFARAADLCAQRNTDRRGAIVDPVLRADWGRIGGGFFSSSTSDHLNAVSLLKQLGGNTPRRGEWFIGLSSGPFPSAKPRESKPMDVNFIPNGCSAIPIGDDDCRWLSNGAPLGEAMIADWTELRLSIRVPTNANAMLFDFSFFTTEFNEYWHDRFNDAFWALVTSRRLENVNVSRDAKERPITVNNGFFQICPRAPGPARLLKPEALENCVGTDGDPSSRVFGTLKGTGFDGARAGAVEGCVPGKRQPWARAFYGGSTGWLTAKFAVDPGETLVIRFAVHDTGDALLDSAVLIDNIRWEKAPPKIIEGETERPIR